MKMMKSLMLMSIGGMSVIAFQKYKKPLMNKLDEFIGQNL